MRAAVCRHFGQPLALEELHLDEPGPGEVRVKIAACAICHSDIIYMDGGWGGDLPAVFGHEAAGIVEGVGTGVAGIRPGDHVVVTLVRSCGACLFCAEGQHGLCETRFALDERSAIIGINGEPIRQALRTAAFAEQVLVHASQVAVIPDEIPLESASLLACGVITGLGAVMNTAVVRPGTHAVTIGTGGVGLNCVQGAALSNVASNIAIDLSPEKLTAAQAFGATHVIDPRADNTREAVRGLTRGRGADYVFVAAGSAPAIEMGATLLRRGGTLVVIGLTSEGVKVAFDALDLGDSALRILGSKMGSVRLQVDIPKLADWYLAGRLKLDELISGRFEFTQINEAIASTRAGSALRNVATF